MVQIKKIIKYFQEYVPTEDSEKILKRIKITKRGGKSEPLKNLEELAKFLYQMRSDFVHRAEMRFFCPSYASFALLVIGDKPYIVDVSMPEILDLFEKSFVSFWKEKYDLLTAQEK